MKMKRCPNCNESVENLWKFCPICSMPFSDLQDYKGFLTILEDEGLVFRLTSSLKEVAEASKLTWPEFKQDPRGFCKRAILGYLIKPTKQYFSRPSVGLGWCVALLLVLAVSIVFVVSDYRNAAIAARTKQEELELTQMISNIPNEQPTPDTGAAGMAKGSGGGSKTEKIKPGGGGGGGREQQQPASFGKLPQVSLRVPQVVAPNPNPPPIKNPSLPMPATLDADPVLFPPDTRNLQYGDPKSKSTDPSSGPGTGNGIGTGTGGGVGSGEGGGYGPGRGGNTGGGDRREGGGGPGGGGEGGDRIYKSSDVTSRARVLSKPEPQYTEAARKNQITGTVVIRAVFSSSGQVTNISTLRGLPDGLTEKAIAAAKQIKFVPAQKDGRPVSMWMQLEYNFNLY